MKDRQTVISLIVLLPALAVGACRPDTTDMHLRHGPPQRTGTLANEAITESSGLAASRAHPGVLWTVNDSGNPPHLYATNAKGENIATCVVEDARNTDWEDLAAYRLGEVAYLLIADVGDNRAQHPGRTLYILSEPPLDANAREQELTAPALMTIPFRYAGGPTDCEAIAVDPRRREILLVTKTTSIAKVYVLPLPTRSPDEPLQARPVAVLILPTVTAMDISPDGRKAIVATYGDAYEFVRRDQESWGEAFSLPPRRLALPPRRQGETICYDLDNQTLYLTSEKLPAPLWTIPARSTPGAAATP